MAVLAVVVSHRTRICDSDPSGGVYGEIEFDVVIAGGQNPRIFRMQIAS